MASASGTATVQERKAAVVEEIRAKLAAADAAVLTEYRGLKVADLAELRGQLRPAGAEYKVFKNTLARRAAEAAGLGDLAGMLEGPVAIAFVRGDAVQAAKALRDFSRTNPALVVKGGLLGPRLLAPADVEALAEVAPRDVLLARLAGGLQAPLQKTAGLLGALTRNVAYGVKALVDQRVAAGERVEPAAPAADAAGPGEPVGPAEAGGDAPEPEPVPAPTAGAGGDAAPTGGAPDAASEAGGGAPDAATEAGGGAPDAATEAGGGAPEGDQPA